MNKECEEKLKNLLKNGLFVDVNMLQYSFYNTKIEYNKVIEVCNKANGVLINDLTLVETMDKSREEELKLCGDFAYQNFDVMNKDVFLLMLINSLNSFIDRNEYRIQQAKPDFLFLWEDIKKEYKKNLDELKLLTRGIKNIYSFALYSQAEEKFYLEILDPRKISINKDKRKEMSKRTIAQLEELDKINDEIIVLDKNNKKESIGLELLLYSIVLTDYEEIFVDSKLGDDFRTVVINNALLKKYPYSVIEKISKNSEEYDNYAKTLKNNDYINILSDLIINNIEYFDINKFLLISAYRYIEYIEGDKEIENNEYSMVYDTLKTCKKFISNKDDFYIELQSKKDEKYDNIKISIQNIEETIGRFDESGERYITKEEYKEIKDKIKSMEIDLNDIPEWKVPILFNENELDEIATLSFENLTYILKYKNWNNDKLFQIIKQHKNITEKMLEFFIENKLLSRKHIEELYCENKISDDCFKYLNNKLKDVNIKDIDEFLKLHNKKELSEDDLNKKEKYEKLYKFYVCNDEEFAKKFSQDLMETIVENYDKKDKNHIVNIEKLYNNSYLKLEDIKEWCGEDVLLNFYAKKILSLDDLIDLYILGKISRNVVSNIAEKEILKKDMSLDDRVKLINFGLISVGTIEKLYMSNLLLDNNIEEFGKNKIISEKKANELINKITFEQRMKNSSFTINGFLTGDIVFDIDELTKNTRNMLGKPNEKKSCDKKIIINPTVRNDFLKILGFVEIETKTKGNCPFSNYNFYAMPNEKGELTANSIIIAERYFKNKDKEDNLVASNATYFYKIKDFLPLTNYTKTEIMKERKGIVYTASHKIANERKNGSWAKSVLLNVAKTSLGSKLNNVGETEKKVLIMKKIEEMYPEKKLRNLINRMIDIIDYDDKYLIEI